MILHETQHREDAEEFIERDPLTRSHLRNSAKQKDDKDNSDDDHNSDTNGQSSDGVHATDEFNEHDFYSEYYAATIGSWGGGGRGDFSKRPPGGGTDEDPGFHDEMADARNRASGLRQKALGVLMGTEEGGEGVGTAHEIFRQVGAVWVESLFVVSRVFGLVGAVSFRAPKGAGTVVFVSFVGLFVCCPASTCSKSRSAQMVWFMFSFWA